MCDSCPVGPGFHTLPWQPKLGFNSDTCIQCNMLQVLQLQPSPAPCTAKGTISAIPAHDMPVTLRLTLVLLRVVNPFHRVWVVHYPY